MMITPAGPRLFGLNLGGAKCRSWQEMVPQGPDSTIPYLIPDRAAQRVPAIWQDLFPSMPFRRRRAILPAFSCSRLPSQKAITRLLWLARFLPDALHRISAFILLHKLPRTET